MRNDARLGNHRQKSKKKSSYGGYAQVSTAIERSNSTIERNSSVIEGLARTIGGLTQSLNDLKDRVDAVEQNSKARIDDVEQNSKARIDDVEQNFKARIDNAEQNFKARIDKVEQNSKAQIDDVEQNVNDRVSNIVQDVNELKKQIKVSLGDSSTTNLKFFVSYTFYLAVLYFCYTEFFKSDEPSSEKHKEGLFFTFLALAPLATLNKKAAATVSTVVAFFPKPQIYIQLSKIAQQFMENMSSNEAQDVSTPERRPPNKG